MKNNYLVIELLSLLVFLLTSQTLGQNFAAGDGTSGNPYQITTATHMNNVRNYLTSYFILNNDIALTDYQADPGWVPIGTSSTSFTGNFNGNGKKITGLRINNTSTDYIGLFGYIGSSGQISNLGIELHTDGVNGRSYVGGLVGYNTGTITTSCYVNGNVSSSSQYGGGLGGYNSGTITSSCYSTGTVTGSSYAGGLAGYNKSTGNITNCYSTSSVSCNTGSGGFVGWNDGSITTGCYATGTVTTVSALGGSYIGGLVGYAGSTSSISNCHASGNIGTDGVNSTQVGGLIGQNDGSVETSYATTGNVKGANQIGGLVGYLGSSGTITKCYATGNVTGFTDTFVGGLVGSNYGTISKSYATGSVTASSLSQGVSAGGLVGYNNSSVTDCYARGNVTGRTEVGGLVGSNYSSITNCYSSGTATASYQYAGGIAGFNQVIGSFSDCFWDTQTSGTSTGVGHYNSPSEPSGQTGKTTAEMKTQSTFTNWNFTTIWEIVATYYPRLKDNADPALPVELTSFTANVIGPSALLNWQTATEVNNYGFDVERRVQNADWQKIGFVQGHGNSNSTKNYFFTDRAITSSGKYYYRLKQIDFDGQFEYSDNVEVEISAPRDFVLHQNYPNPFNPTTVISWQIAVGSQVSLKVYDTLGREVATLVDEYKPAGSYYCKLKLENGELSSGVYFYRLITDNKSEMKKMILIK